MNSFDRTIDIYMIHKIYTCTVHEITAGHRSLSGTISYVTDRISFLLVTMTNRFSKFNSLSYTEDRHELPVTGTNCEWPAQSGDCRTRCPALVKYLFQALNVRVFRRPVWIPFCASIFDRYQLPILWRICWQNCVPLEQWQIQEIEAKEHTYKEHTYNKMKSS